MQSRAGVPEGQACYCLLHPREGNPCLLPASGPTGLTPLPRGGQPSTPGADGPGRRLPRAQRAHSLRPAAHSPASSASSRPSPGLGHGPDQQGPSPAPYPFPRLKPGAEGLGSPRSLPYPIQQPPHLLPQFAVLSRPRPVLHSELSHSTGHLGQAPCTRGQQPGQPGRGTAKAALHLS